jgi:hypothetical protein
MTATRANLAGALSAEPTAFDANVSATGLRLQSGSAPTGSFAYNGNTDRVISAPGAVGGGTDFATAITNGNYLAFTLTPNAGYTMSLSSITFQAASGSTSLTSNRAFFLVSEATGGTFSASSAVLRTDRTPVGGGTMANQAATITNTIPTDYSVDLSGITRFQSISSSAIQTFRLYIQVPTTTQAVTFDDIIVNGTVTAIPEPSTFAAFAGFATLGLAFYRRRRAV